MKNRLNVLLATTDHLAGMFKKGLTEYIKFFKGSQGAFIGERKTYTPKLGTIDIPGERSYKRVVTTVAEKLEYLVENSKDYIDALFSQEKTNSMGVANARLVVDDVDFGELSSLELLRLKSILELPDFREMYENIPVRNESEIWDPSTDVEHTGKDIYQSVARSGILKTTTKESYILPDPNIGKSETIDYRPQVATKDTVIELGDYSHQKFSGEYSHLQRAMILNRRGKLLTAVIAALKVANEAEAIPSSLTSDKIFNYLHFGK